MIGFSDTLVIASSTSANRTSVSPRHDLDQQGADIHRLGQGGRQGLAVGTERGAGCVAEALASELWLMRKLMPRSPGRDSGPGR